ncbi:hypothetical protein DL98DRAFT_587203 [Cadophora sp. DSE1049]|nr:hypothetical protein DL98DRAFT_587203 [Cadophora sp. DSE1049]
MATAAMVLDEQSSQMRDDVLVMTVWDSKTPFAKARRFRVLPWFSPSIRLILSRVRVLS